VSGPAEPVLAITNPFLNNMFVPFPFGVNVMLGVAVFLAFTV
jgi:hypothetical protein